MNRQNSSDECLAKAEALEECADHLLQNWTYDPMWRKAGNRLSDTLRKRANKWRKLAKSRSTV